MTNYINAPRISYETAAKAVALTMEVGARHGIRPVVAVADPSMTIVASGLADGATPHSAETSRRKAMTAASTRKRSSQIPEALATAIAIGTDSILTRIDGGFPLFFDGVHVGGLGVAGGTPAQDADVAVEVLELLGADAIGDAQ